MISALLFIAGMPVEAAITAGPVVVNIGIGVFQEARAKQQLDRIALLRRPKATVVRDGREREVDPSEIVLGDVVIARRGDQIVVDGTIVGDARIELDELLLTGESDPVSKQRGEQVFSGTAVVSGTVAYQTEKVGEATVANRLLTEARRMADDQTPLQRGIATTIWAIAGLVIATAAIVALTGLPGNAVGSTETLAAAAVLVTLVPQGLAIMITVTYAAGSLRVTRLGALVQRRNAVELMSRVDTLCLDKTGTLTTQRISFRNAEPLGTWASDSAGGASASDGSSIHVLLGTLARSTDAPNRTTDALAAAMPGAASALDDEIPFNSERRWSAARFSSADDATPPASVFVMGLPPRSAPGSPAAKVRSSGVPARSLPKVFASCWWRVRRMAARFVTPAANRRCLSASSRSPSCRSSRSSVRTPAKRSRRSRWPASSSRSYRATIPPRSRPSPGRSGYRSRAGRPLAQSSSISTTPRSRRQSLPQASSAGSSQASRRGSSAHFGRAVATWR